MPSDSSCGLPPGVDAEPSPPPLNRCDRDSVWPAEFRFPSRDVEADADEGSNDGCGESIGSSWDSSSPPRTVDFFAVVVGLVVIVRCGWPNAKPIAAIPTVPDAQSYSGSVVSTVICRTAVRTISSTIHGEGTPIQRVHCGALGCTGAATPSRQMKHTDDTASITTSDCECGMTESHWS